MKRFHINKIAISITNIDNVLYSIDKTIQQNEYGYICVTNSRIVHLSNNDDEVLQDRK